MKTLLTLFVLFFSSNLYAEVGDKYFCKTTSGVLINETEMHSINANETFAFEWNEKIIKFSKEGAFAHAKPKILYGFGEMFYAITYMPDPMTFEETIPYDIYSFYEGKITVTTISGPIGGVITLYAKCDKF